MPDPEAFDPAKVPPYPVFHIHYDETEDTATVEGVPVQPESGQTAKEGAIATLSERLRVMELEAAHARVTSPDGEVWRMVVTVEGDVHDLTQPDEGEDKTRFGVSRRRLFAGVGALALVGAGGGAAAVLVPQLNESPPPAPWRIPGEGEQVPVALPDSFSTRARWAFPIARNSTLCRLTSGQIGTVNEQGVLALHDPKTAEPMWRGANAPDDLSNAVRTRWDGRDVLAVATSSELLIWSMESTGSVVTPRSIDLDPSARAELRGPEPFIELDDWIVKLPQGKDTREETIHAGTRPALYQDGTLHSIGRNRVYHLHPSGEESSTKLGLPDGPKDMPVGVWALSADLALSAWEMKKGTRLVVMRLPRAEVLLDTTVGESIDAGTVPEPLSATAFLLSRTVILWGESSPQVFELDQFKPTAASGSTLVGIDRDGRPASLSVRGKVTSTPWDGHREDDPTPTIITETAAYVVAQRLDETWAYSAPRKGAQ